MASLNKVLLMGNLTRDPELRYLDSGTEVVKFGLATNRRYKAQNGEMKEDTTFVDVTFWGKQAVVINQHLTKGSPIFIEGRLTFSTWEREGTKHSKLEVTGENFQFIGPKGDRGPRGPVGSEHGERASSDQASANVGAPAEAAVSAGDDDIPF